MATLTAAAEPLALDAGSPNVATLKIGGQTLAQAIVTGLHQTDWQGRLALSNQPRTNQATQSGNPTNWANKSGVTITQSGTAPNGQPAYAVAATAVSGHWLTANAPTYTGNAAATWYVKANGYPVVQVQAPSLPTTPRYASFNLSTGQFTTTIPAGLTISAQALADGWYAISISGSVNATAQSNLFALLPCPDGISPSSTGDGVSGFLFGGIEQEFAASAGAYIPTTTAPVTVLDYTQSAAQITLGQNPATGATLDWDGSGILPGTNWSWPASLPKISSDNFAYAPLVDNVLVTQMETGAPKRRRRFTYVPETLTGTLTLTGAQAATLETFVATTLRDVQPFDWKDLRDGSVASYIFTKRPTFTQVAGGVDLWSTAIELMKQ